MTSLPYDAYDDHDVRGQRQNQDDQFKTSSPYDANANTNDSAIKCRIDIRDKSSGDDYERDSNYNAMLLPTL